MTVSHPRVTVGHLRVTVGHLRVTVSHPRVTVGHLRVTIGHLRVTIGYLRITIGHLIFTFLSLSQHKANTTELHPKVRPTCVDIILYLATFSTFIISTIVDNAVAAMLHGNDHERLLGECAEDPWKAAAVDINNEDGGYCVDKDSFSHAKNCEPLQVQEAAAPSSTSYSMWVATDSKAARTTF